MSGMGKKPKTKRTKSPTGVEQDPILSQAKTVLRAVKNEQKEKKGYQSGNGYKYEKVWNEEGTAFEYRTKARVVLEKVLGRPLEDHERVFFKNRELKGDAKYAPENLVLGYKAGVPLDMLTCSNCGCRGNWTVNPPSNGNQGSAE